MNRPADDRSIQESYTINESMQPRISQNETGYGSLSASSNENPFQAASRNKASKKAGADGWDAEGWGNDEWGEAKDDWKSKDDWNETDDWGSNDNWGNNESSKKNRNSVNRKNGDW